MASSTVCEVGMTLKNLEALFELIGRTLKKVKKDPT
jgi:hypothetical protein